MKLSGAVAWLFKLCLLHSLAKFAWGSITEPTSSQHQGAAAIHDDKQRSTELIITATNPVKKQRNLNCGRNIYRRCLSKAASILDECQGRHTSNNCNNSPIDFLNDEHESRNSNRIHNRLAASKVLNLPRGGEVKQIKGKKAVGLGEKARNLLAGVQPVTKVYLFLTVFCALVHMLGLPAPVLFGLDHTKLLELWRPITSMSYLGPPSMSMANSVFFLVRFGQAIETDSGSGAYAWFLMVQTVILSILGWTFGFPFIAQSMIAAIIHVCSRISPLDPM